MSVLSENADYPWDSFDSYAYLAHNYRTLRDDDARLSVLMRDFLAGLGLRQGRARGFDIGTGTNLYPALGLLPWVAELSLVEFAASNVAWLEQEVRQYGHDWDPFWNLYCQDSSYAAITDPRQALSQRAKVTQGSVFDLEPQAWDLGSMYFVAESMTSDHDEFERALSSFARAIRPGGAFVAAFMEDSEGYDVGELRFPAVKIRESHIRAVLEPLASTLSVCREAVGGDALRPGYTGMLLALGVMRPT